MTKRLEEIKKRDVTRTVKSQREIYYLITRLESAKKVIEDYHSFIHADKDLRKRAKDWLKECD